jgi:hypothetical protein
MKKLFMILPLVMVLCFVSGCQKQEQVERFMENGVEVVVNHLEPYKLRGVPNNLVLEEEFTIDTENDDIAETGLTDIGAYFDIDCQGNIYLNSYQNVEGTIFKFDRDGNFVCSFSRKGQGPGELQGNAFRSLYLSIDHEDNIAVSDRYNKLTIFGSEGDLIEETKINSNTLCTVPLENGNFISYILVLNNRAEYLIQNPLTLFNSQHEEIKELEKQMVPNPLLKKRVKAVYNVLTWSVSKGEIFIGLPERGYEISIYDFEGKLLRKIKKEYKHIPVPEEYKIEFLKSLYDDIKNQYYFPDSMDPFHSFFTDDEGRLFIMTYEKGENPGEYLYDIFNPEGVFICRKSLKVYQDGGGLYAKVKKGLFYCLNEKESGYKELVVYRMSWE